MRARYVWLIGGSVAIVVAAAMLVSMRMRPGQQVVTPLYSDAALQALPQKDSSNIDTSHLTDDLTPPTNRWFSGIALQATPKRVFPLPLSFEPGETSFTIDMPGVEASEKVIMAVPRVPVAVQLQGAHHYQVTRYDTASVELTYFTQDNATLGTVTLAAGSPYVYFQSQTDATLEITGQNATKTRRDTTITYSIGDASVTAAVFNGAHMNATATSISAPKGSLVTLFAVTSPGDWDTLMQYAAHTITSTAVSFERDGDEYVTTLRYITENQQPTLFARMPHHGGNGSGPRYDTIYGPVTLQKGTALQYRTAAVPVQAQLSLATLSSTNKQLLIDTLIAETDATGAYPEDTYFAGKMMYRDAQLLLLAKQLGQAEVAERLRLRLDNELALWLSPDGSATKSFYYDTKARGVVGVAPAFGSESFNDHHFHYGYFIYAASVLAQIDEQFAVQYGEAVKLLIADIAHPTTDHYFPAYRVYDPYFGHSWASGDAPFADGNNQESSSEAMNAWIGIALWAEQTNDTEMAARAGWLLSNESAAAGAYWLNFNRNVSPYQAYGRSLISLNWGGKRDYATFFSSSPKAMLGVQLIPMSPSVRYMAGYGERITEGVAEARGNQASGAEQFDDYVLMYEALAKNNNSLLTFAQALPDTAIDGANSRTYLYAWLLAE